MKTREIAVDGVDPRTGETISKPAVLVICDKCDSESFHFLVVDGHTHIQCTGCGASYCGGHGQCSVHPQG